VAELQLRVRITNSALAIIPLNQYGTGVRVNFPAQEQEDPPAGIVWEPVRVFEILLEHDVVWPGETVSEDLLLNVGRGPTIAMAEVRIIHTSSVRRLGWELDRWGNVQFARKIILPDAAIIDDG
jgi:hypothetical protein